MSRRRAVGRSENPGMPVLFGGHNLPPLVEIGLTNLSKSGDAIAQGRQACALETVKNNFNTKNLSKRCMQ